MTGLEAAEEEADRRRQRRLVAGAAEADKAQDEYEKREERAAVIAEHGQQSQSQLSLDLSSSPSYEADNSKARDHDIFTEMENLVALAACDVDANVPGRKAGKGKRKESGEKEGKAKAMSTSQLMEEFNLESQ
jgi:hypothetical protein